VALACAAENQRGLAEAELYYAQALAELQGEAETTLSRFPEPVLLAARAAAEEVLAELAARDALAGRIHASFLAARERAVAWGEVSRHALLGAQLLPA